MYLCTALAIISLARSVYGVTLFPTMIDLWLPAGVALSLGNHESSA